MADEADMAAPHTESMNSEGIPKAKEYRRLVACELCPFCSSTVDRGHLFCDTDCAADWQHEQDRRKALGR